MNAYEQLIAFLDENKASYRLIDHAAEGRTDVVSPLRGNKLADAAKCIVVMLKIGKKATRYVLAVVPGDRKLDLNAIKALYWSAVLNGVVAVPIMIVMMLVASRADIMGRFVVQGRLRTLGWLATLVMLVIALAMLATSF